MGVDGGVGSTYSYAASIYNKLMKAYDEGNVSKTVILFNSSGKRMAI